MATVIAVSNQKGGVGKTTTSYSIALCLRKKGYRVLAVDLDSQGNLGYCMGADTENIPTSYNLFRGEVSAEDAIQHTEMCDVIAGNILLSSVEMEFTNSGREFLLKNALASVMDKYDYIILDTPPALSILTINAFTVANYVIIPMLSDMFSLQGITQLCETVEQVKKYCNPQLKIAGILLTKFNSRTLLGREIKGTAQMFAEQKGIPLFETTIRSSVAITEAQSIQTNMLEYASQNKAVQDYMDFVDELAKRGI